MPCVVSQNATDYSALDTPLRRCIPTAAAAATPPSRARYVSFVQEVPRLARYPGAVNLIGVLMFVTVTARFGVIEDLLGAINLCSARFFSILLFTCLSGMVGDRNGSRTLRKIVMLSCYVHTSIGTVSGPRDGLSLFENDFCNVTNVCVLLFFCIPCRYRRNWLR